MLKTLLDIVSKLATPFVLIWELVCAAWSYARYPLRRVPGISATEEQNSWSDGRKFGADFVPTFLLLLGVLLFAATFFEPINNVDIKLLVTVALVLAAGVAYVVAESAQTFNPKRLALVQTFLAIVGGAGVLIAIGNQIGEVERLLRTPDLAATVTLSIRMEHDESGLEQSDPWTARIRIDSTALPYPPLRDQPTNTELTRLGTAVTEKALFELRTQAIILADIEVSNGGLDTATDITIDFRGPLPAMLESFEPPSARCRAIVETDDALFVECVRLLGAQSLNVRVSIPISELEFSNSQLIDRLKSMLAANATSIGAQANLSTLFCPGDLPVVLDVFFGNLVTDLSDTLEFEVQWRNGGVPPHLLDTHIPDAAPSAEVSVGCA